MTPSDEAAPKRTRSRHAARPPDDPARTGAAPAVPCTRRRRRRPRRAPLVAKAAGELDGARRADPRVRSVRAGRTATRARHRLPARVRAARGRAPVRDRPRHRGRRSPTRPKRSTRRSPRSGSRCRGCTARRPSGAARPPRRPHRSRRAPSTCWSRSRRSSRRVVVAFGPRAVEAVRALDGRCGLVVPDEIPQGRAVRLRPGLSLIATEPLPEGVTEQGQQAPAVAGPPARARARSRRTGADGRDALALALLLCVARGVVRRLEGTAGGHGRAGPVRRRRRIRVVPSERRRRSGSATGPRSAPRSRRRPPSSRAG